MTRRIVLTLLVALAVAGSGCLEQFQSLRDQTQAPGEAAGDYVRNDKYSKLVVEVNYPRGSEPKQLALDHIEETLKEVTAKDSVEIVLREGLKEFPARGQEGKYSFDEIRALEDANRQSRSGGDTAVLYILYVDGGSDRDNGNSRVLGAHYQGSSIVMFKGNIKAASRDDNSILGFQATERCVERAVLLHEVGHALGLVNMGAPMTHAREHAGHEGHSKYKDSVMYYALENTADLANLFSGGCSEIPYEFDQYDLADLRALREGK